MINTDVRIGSERYSFIKDWNPKQYEDGTRYVFSDELEGYTFFPYEGGLRTVPGYCENRNSFETARIYLLMDEDGRVVKVPCSIVESRKRIYITECNFNKFWRLISARLCRGINNRDEDSDVTQESLNSMVDLSLVTPPQGTAFINDAFTIEHKGNEVDIEIQRMVSKRANAMQDNKIRFVYAGSDQLVHDKSCPLAQEIPYWDFGAAENLPEDRKLCGRCKRKIYIRNAMHRDRKHFPWYWIFFDKGYVSTAVLERFLCQGGAKLYMPMVDEMEVTYKEDTWLIKMDRKGDFELLHNNYERLGDDERCITSGFHVQKYSPTYLPGIIGYIEGYDWRKHLEAEEAEETIVNEAGDGDQATQSIAPVEEEQPCRSSWWKRIVSWFRKVWSKWI